MRLLLLPLLAGLATEAAQAQASVASDLWRVAAGTLVVPAALADDGTASLWTPAAVVGGASRYQVGVEAIHAPSEIGVNGGVAAFGARAAGLGTINVSYGRVGIAGVGYTETSPEIVGSPVEIYNQVASLGLAGRLAQGLTAGVALRYLSGRMGLESRDQFGLDFGAQYTGIPRLRLGIATHYFDPTFGSSGEAASVNLAAEVRTKTLDAWGAATTLAFRGGITAAHGDEKQALLTGGVSLGPSFTLDYGAAYETTGTDSVWRSRLGVAIGAGKFTARIARDGGVNGFGATYRFGLTALFQ